MKKILVILTILTVIPFVSAQNTSQELCDYLTEQVSEPQQIPSYIPYSNEHIQIETTNDVSVGHAVLEDKQARFVNCSSSKNKTYTVQIENVDTIETILSSNNPQQSFEEAKQNNSLVIRGETAWKRTKLSALNIVMTVYNWF